MTDLAAKTPRPYDGFLTQLDDGSFEVAAAGVVIDRVTDEEVARSLLSEHAADRPRWKVAADGERTRIG